MNNHVDCKRILAVDDNELTLEALSELLERDGFSVLTARSAIDGLHQARTDGHIGLILLDLWMPVMDGWEFLRRKIDDPGIAGIPVIVLSAIPPFRLEPSTLNDGVKLVLQKPIDPQRLIDAVEQYCG